MEEAKPCKAEEPEFGDFMMKMPDNSMDGVGIFPDDLVELVWCDTVENGTIAAVDVNKKVFLRKVWKGDGVLTLAPANPCYPATTFFGDEIHNAKILAKAIASRHYLSKK